MEISKNYHIDPSGLAHYQSRACLDNVFLAAKEAIEDWLSPAAWFWFRGTPAPIHPGDTDSALAHRWEEWNKMWLAAPHLLDFVKTYAGIES